MNISVLVQREPEVAAATTARQKAAVRVMRGIGASAGIAVGPCRVISRPEDLRSLKKGEIMVFHTADTALYIEGLKGLITEVGGQLTIAAHYAREHHVPHVAGVGDLTVAVTTGQMIRIDGLKGTVNLL
jgi:pyruvate, water dikinase